MRGTKTLVLALVAAGVLLSVASVILWNAVVDVTSPDQESPRDTEFSETGSYLIGPDIEPGIYQSTSTNASCRWTVYSRGVTVRTGEGSGFHEAEVARHYSSFDTRSCGPWRLFVEPVVDQGKSTNSSSSAGVDRSIDSVAP